MRLIDADALLKELNDLFEWCRDSRSAGLEQSMCMIHEQPTILQWIPVSERLPDVGKHVLISKINGYIALDYIDEENHWHWVFDNWVLAWMPLPEPYKESDK